MRFKQIKQVIKESLLEDQDLMEIKMTGGNLSKLAKEIKGVMVGLEFEMIVPNTEVDDDEMEPDYDMDERVEDIDDACNFFDDGDHNSDRMIRELRNEMEDEYFSWKTEQIDEDWGNNGYEYLQEFMDREDAFDRYDEDMLEDAENYVRENKPELEIGTDEYQQAVSDRVDELEAAFIQSEWEDQGEWYDRAREEFDDDHSDDYSERDWLRDHGLYYAQDIQNHFSAGVIWPHWTSGGGDEADIKKVALDFMRDSGLPYKSVAVSSSYHGSYEKWNGSEWVNIGSSKPSDCFAIEPDGSLDGDNPGDAGLEFVSPPIPLEQVGEVMSKVQKWASENGVYTGKSNATSMHTNISIPGYSIDKLDYVKAALLLGDEHVLRQFDRIGNSYAKPAIEKIKTIIRDRPQKAAEMLDKMKSQLNAAASKVLHSGITDKFTSINTKDNRIEFRSPGGDYLSDIADNPKKMQDTINRMVVAMDAAMDPNKYKEEYQKKLYKVLTGDIGSRKGKTGELEWTVKSKANVWDKDTRRQRPAFSLKVEAKTAKDAWKALKSMLPPGAIESEYTITPNKIPTPSSSNKDLLNVFTRYAAGEMPAAALKSFLRQAQFQRKVERDPTLGEKYWWNVKLDGQRIEVVATNKREAFDVALDERPEWMRYNINQAEITPLRPYVEEPAAGQGVPGLYKIFSASGQLIAGDEYGSDEEALGRAAYWARQRGVDVVVRNAEGQEVGRVSAFGEITPTTQQQGTTVAGRPNNPEGNWYLKNADTDEIFYRFNASDYSDAHTVLQQWKEENPNSDINVVYGRGRYETAQQFAPVPGSTLDLQRQRAARADAEQSFNEPSWFVRPTGQPGREIQVRAPDFRTAIERARHIRTDIFADLRDNQIEVRSGEAGSRSEPVNTTQPQTPGQGHEYEMYRISDGRTVTGPSGNEIRFRARDDGAAEEMRDRYANQFNLGSPRLFAVRSVLRPIQQSAGTPANQYELYNRETGQVIDTYPAQNDDQAMVRLRDYRNFGGGVGQPSERFGVRRSRSGLDVGQTAPQQSAVNTPPAGGTGEGLRGNWGFWMTNADRFAAWPGASNDNLRRFSSREAAQQWLDGAREANPRMRTDIEIREIEPTRQPARDINLFPDIPSQADANWEIVRDRDNQVVARFRASDQENAIQLGNTYMRSNGLNIDEHTLQAIEQPTNYSGVHDFTPHGPGPWELYNTQTGSVFKRLEHTNRRAAQTEAETYYHLNSSTLGDIANYGVRTQRAQSNNQVGEVYRPTGSGSFTGQWMVLDGDNRIVYKFGGIGNSQSDANRVAMDWLRQNPRYLQDGTSVVPEMG